MLKLRNICKYYEFGKNKRIILNNISIDFKSRELVFILGRSGSGKSTLLNIIAGNLKCDSGEIYLDNELVSSFKDKRLDNYRRSVIGNIFQDYNLIEYMNVFDNVMLGTSCKVDNIMLDTLLKQLSIYDKKYQLVNKLSGGEKQRVAIARAMINDPDIILADEPTGALDSLNSIKIMEILKKISKNKLVIVVSHDQELANKYADRIINIKDGTLEYIPQIDNSVMREIKKTKIKWMSIVKLAIKNLWLKKRRTIFTSLTVALGMISMILVLGLSKGFNKEIDNLEKEVVSIFPIRIENGEFIKEDSKINKSNNKIIIKDRDKYIHKNIINDNYIKYIENIKEISYITYDYDISMPIISDRYKSINNEYLEVIPSGLFINNNYEILSGRNIDNKYEILLKVDSNNNVDSEILNYFDIDSDIEYEEIIGRELSVIINDNYYINKDGYYYVNDNMEQMYRESNIKLKIVGVVREKEIINDISGILYDGRLIDWIIEMNTDSEIVNSQLNTDKNVLGLNINKSDMLAYLGYNSLPVGINIYVDNLDNKKMVLDYLDEYNLVDDTLIYTDLMDETIEIVREFISIISIILIIFSLIAIIISILMIGILTNTRVIERKKEIGIFRSLGASRRDISRLFNIENMIIGIISSVFGIIIILLLFNPINKVMNMFIDIDNIFRIDYMMVGIVLLVNILIVKIAGFIPSRMASKLEIVKCIYNK